MSRPFAKLKEEIKKEILQLSFPVGQPYVTHTDNLLINRKEVNLNE